MALKSATVTASPKSPNSISATNIPQIRLRKHRGFKKDTRGCQVSHRVADREIDFRRLAARKFERKVAAAEKEDRALREEARDANKNEKTLEKLERTAKKADAENAKSGCEKLRKFAAKSASALKEVLYTKNPVVRGGAPDLANDPETVRLQKMQNYESRKRELAVRREVAERLAKERKAQDELYNRRNAGLLGGAAAQQAVEYEDQLIQGMLDREREQRELAAMFA